MSTAAQRKCHHACWREGTEEKSWVGHSGHHEHRSHQVWVWVCVCRQIPLKERIFWVNQLHWVKICSFWSPAECGTKLVHVNLMCGSLPANESSDTNDWKQNHWAANVLSESLNLLNESFHWTDSTDPGHLKELFFSSLGGISLDQWSIETIRLFVIPTGFLFGCANVQIKDCVLMNPVVHF